MRLDRIRLLEKRRREIEELLSEIEIFLKHIYMFNEKDLERLLDLTDGLVGSKQEQEKVINK
jgi:hypothetical protein